MRHACPGLPLMFDLLVTLVIPHLVADVCGPSLLCVPNPPAIILLIVKRKLLHLYGEIARFQHLRVHISPALGPIEYTTPTFFASRAMPDRMVWVLCMRSSIILLEHVGVSTSVNTRFKSIS